MNYFKKDQLSKFGMDVKQVLAKYQNPEKSLHHMNQATTTFRGLSVSYGPFAFSSGITKTLANLQGTIPVSYKGVLYHIPICIWLMETYPLNPPVCYVKPTSTMKIKMSKNVDHTGKIYLPYLHDWNPPTSNILGVIQIMILSFGEFPPLYTVTSTENKQIATTPYPQQSYMPMPGIGPNYSPYPQQAAPVASPPYPTPNTGMPSSTQYSPYYSPNSNQTPTIFSSYTQSTGTTVTPPARPPPPTISSNTDTINEEYIKASLISAVEHKLKRKLDDFYQQNKAELDILQQTAMELCDGKNKLDSIFKNLDEETIEFNRNISFLREKDIELDKVLNDVEKMCEIDVDDAVMTTAPLYNQILNSYSEESATEDAIYYMGEALRGGVIDLDVFLKNVRALSRKQFMFRALIQKCRQKAGLSI